MVTDYEQITSAEQGTNMSPEPEDTSAIYRPMLWLHTPLTSSTEVSGHSHGIQENPDIVDEQLHDARNLGLTARFHGLNHQALFIGPRGLTHEQITLETRLTRVELTLPGHNSKNLPIMEMTKNITMKSWKPTSFFDLTQDLGDAMTIYSDDEIEEIANAQIRTHGSYDFLANNCQNFAVVLYDKICCLNPSRSARASYRIAKFKHDNMMGDTQLRTGANFAVAGVGVVVVGGLGVVGVEELLEDEEGEDGGGDDDDDDGGDGVQVSGEVDDGQDGVQDSDEVDDGAVGDDDVNEDSD